MLVYLDEVYDRRQREGGMTTQTDLYDAVMEGAVERVRPKMMTVVAITAGLLPIMWTTGSGADVMKRIAAPMIGGMVTSTILTLFIIPAIYLIWRGSGLGKGKKSQGPGRLLTNDSLPDRLAIFLTGFSETCKKGEVW